MDGSVVGDDLGTAAEPSQFIYWVVLGCRGLGSRWLEPIRHRRSTYPAPLLFMLFSIPFPCMSGFKTSCSTPVPLPLIPLFFPLLILGFLIISFAFVVPIHFPLSLLGVTLVGSIFPPTQDIRGQAPGANIVMHSRTRTATTGFHSKLRAGPRIQSTHRYFWKAISSRERCASTSIRRRRSRG